MENEIAELKQTVESLRKEVTRLSGESKLWTKWRVTSLTIPPKTRRTFASSSTSMVTIWTSVCTRRSVREIGYS